MRSSLSFLRNPVLQREICFPSASKGGGRRGIDRRGTAFHPKFDRGVRNSAQVTDLVEKVCFLYFEGPKDAIFPNALIHAVLSVRYVHVKDVDVDVVTNINSEDYFQLILLIW